MDSVLLTPGERVVLRCPQSNGNVRCFPDGRVDGAGADAANEREQWDVLAARVRGFADSVWGDDASARAASARAVRLRSVAYPFLCLRVGGRRGSPTGAGGALGGAVDAGADGRGACAAFEVEPRAAAGAEAAGGAAERRVALKVALPFHAALELCEQHFCLREPHTMHVNHADTRLLASFLEIRQHGIELAQPLIQLRSKLCSRLAVLCHGGFVFRLLRSLSLLRLIIFSLCLTCRLFLRLLISIQSLLLIGLSRGAPFVVVGATSFFGASGRRLGLSLSTSLAVASSSSF